MSVIMQINPFEFFTDTHGDALDAGYIWIGQVNKDPRQYPVTAYFDAALTIPAAMPLRTSNGYIVRNGSPSFLYISGNYSIMVLDKQGRQIFYVPDFLLIGNGTAISAGELLAASGSSLVGFTQNATGPLLRTAQDKMREVVSVTDYALWAPGTYAAALQAAINDVATIGRGKVMVPLKGTFPLESTVNLGRNSIVQGAGLEYTFFSWNGTGPAFNYQPAGFNPGSHALEDLSVVGGPNAAAIGVEISDTFGFRLENVGISGFTGGRGLQLHNRNFWTEGTVLLNTRIGNNKISVAFVRDPSIATDSFGYTRFLNTSILVNGGQTGILVGDDAISTQLHTLYNAILNANIWLFENNPTGIAFGANGVISDGNGLLNGEGTSGTGGVMVVPNTLTNGFRNSDVFVRSSPLNQTQTVQSTFRDFRYRKIRDISEQRPGQGTVPQWFKVARIGTVQGLFTGRVSTQSQFGQSANRSAICDFAFGVAGGSPLPQFSVSGEGFNGSGSYASQFKMGSDATGTYLYYRRPSFSHVCVFEYSYDWTVQETVELWQTSADPSTIVGVTVTYDSFNDAAQQMFNGDEQVCTGQRTTFVTNGGSTTYTIAHGLGVIPEWFNASALSGDATNTGILSVSANTTNVFVQFKTTTPVGVDNIRIFVEYGRKAYQKQFRPT